MFAPRHQRTADEMARVCRRGGKIVTATWRPEGTVGDVFRASASCMPPPPEYASAPILWGSENYVRERFAAVATGFEFECHVNIIDWDSLDSWTEYFMQRFGPMVTAREMLGERFGELRQRVVEIWRNANQSTNGRLRLPQEYLISVVSL
jgi:hypothetical protein